MQRFYFDTADGDRDTDEQGVQLATEDDAVRQAIQYAGALIADQPAVLTPASPLEVTVRSDDRKVAIVRIELSRLA